MKKRPFQLEFLTLLIAVAAWMFPAQLFALYGFSIEAWVAEVEATSSMMVAIFGWSVGTAILAFRGSPWLMVTQPIYLALVAAGSWIVPGFRGWVDPGFDVMFTTILMISHLVLLTPRVRELLFRPAQRWWLASPRKVIGSPAELRPFEGGELVALAVDISDTGAYFTGNRPDFHLKPGSRCNLRLKLNAIHSLHCVAQIKRVCGQSSGQYPAGFAVKFVEMSRRDRALLKDYLKAAALPQTVAA